MLSKADNEAMCRVGADTPMGKVLRSFWLPAFQLSELPSNSESPLLFELLGEKLVAFRDSNGEIGVLAEACCHRGASLGLARVEKCGLRCIYHGWLFDKEGHVIETPNVSDDRFRSRIRQPNYPVREAGGLAWVYLGQNEKLPPMPDFPWMDAPVEDVMNACVFVKANWVQVLEGIVDSSHLSILHKSGLEKALGLDVEFAKKTSHMNFDAAPRIEAELTDWGLQYAALRNVDGKQETRVTAMISPLFVLNPNGDLWFAVVPISDDRTAFFHIWWDDKGSFRTPETRAMQLEFLGLADHQLEEFRLTRQGLDDPSRPGRHNRWFQDRNAIRDGHFSGLLSFTQEDAMLSESGGAIRDRSKEILSTADLAIAHTYRALMRNVRAVQDGEEPAAADQKIGHLRGASAQLEAGTDWRSIVPGNLETPDAVRQKQPA